MTETLTSAAAPPAPPGNLFPDPHGREPLRAELFGLEHLEAHARYLAVHAGEARVTAGEPLLGRFLRNSRALVRAHREIVEAYRNQETFGSDAEWLLDNFHIIADALSEIRTDLPGGYYKLLPKLVRGPLKGFPRVYALALELVVHCDSCLDDTHLTRFVQAYQTITPLTIGELWAIPIMLRLVLIDNLRRLAEQIVHVRAERHAARAAAACCLPAPSANNHPAAARPFTPPFQEKKSDPFLVHLWEQLREHGPEGSAVLEWLEGFLKGHGLTTAEVLRRDQQRQAANQVSIGNCVTSLRLLSTQDWMSFFENTSLVEAVLREDPAGVYPQQDFPTRDRYRQTVEKLARGSGKGEIDVARQVVALAAGPISLSGTGGTPVPPSCLRRGLGTGRRLTTSAITWSAKGVASWRRPSATGPSRATCSCGPFWSTRRPSISAGLLSSPPSSWPCLSPMRKRPPRSGPGGNGRSPQAGRCWPSSCWRGCCRRASWRWAW